MVHTHPDILPLGYAAMALRCFRRRHEHVPRYKHPSKRRKDSTVSIYAAMVLDARHYIMIARKARFRGPIVSRLMAGEPVIMKAA